MNQVIQLKDVTKMARKKTKEQREEEKRRNVEEVQSLFDTAYGRNMSRLQAWQDLCRDVGVPVEESIRKCQKVRPRSSSLHKHKVR